LLSWQAVLQRSSDLPPPPQEPLPALPLNSVQTPEAAAVLAQLNPEQLQRVANRLVVLNRIHHVMESTERRWQALLR
jgi:flagellar motor switch protein FliG